MTSICIIGVYFGQLPSYFDLWLRSAEKNNTIDFFVFTDQKKDILPQNVHFFPMDILTMKRMAEDALGFSVCLDKPYKCCDFKAVYGLIFQKYIRKYDYWGHCDFDLIWGDLRSFFEKYHLSKYDKFLPLGHLSLYRNTYQNNIRYKCSGSVVGDYKTVFTSSKGYAFDEIGGIYNIFKLNHFPMFTKRIFADISMIYRRFRLALDDQNYNHQVFYWNNGKIFRTFEENGVLRTDEFIYIHFKKRGKLNHDSSSLVSPVVYITNKGFFGANCLPNSEDIDFYNPFPGRSVEKIEFYNSKLLEYKDIWKHRLNKILHVRNRMV